MGEGCEEVGLGGDAMSNELLRIAESPLGGRWYIYVS